MKQFNSKSLLMVAVLTLSHIFQSKATSLGYIVGRIAVIESGDGIANAEIVFENKMDKIVAYTNDHGYYYANHLPSGKYSMKISYNKKVFAAKNIHVFDGYTTEINLNLSNSTTLPELNEVKAEENIITANPSNDILISTNKNNQPTRSLNDVLSTQPGMDVRDGNVYIKGSNQVRFFIDGTPVMGSPAHNRVW